ncbi:MAG: hypothetical protein ACMUHB_04960 [Thermoplasmatota archaeon]
MNLIKLGGSIVTYKGSDTKPPFRWDETSLSYRVREDRLREISDVLKEHLDQGLVLVHGGGTHGHRTVLRWRNGVDRVSENLMAWEVKWRMLQLTEEITRVLGRGRIPVIPVSPSDVMTMSDGGISSFDSSPISRILERDCVPLLRGDLAPVETGGWSVISGDEIMVRLAMEASQNKLPGITRAVMCMDVEGFFDSYGSPQSRIIDRIDDRSFHSNISRWTEKGPPNSGKGDVSGGILGKVISCHRISSLGIQAYMIGGDLRSTLSSVLSGEGGGTVFPPFQGGPECVDGNCW